MHGMANAHGAHPDSSSLHGLGPRRGGGGGRIGMSLCGQHTHLASPFDRCLGLSRQQPPKFFSFSQLLTSQILDFYLLSY